MLRSAVSSLTVAMLTVAAPTDTLAAAYKCTGKDGKVLYQDSPCAPAAASGGKLRTWENSTAEPDFRVKPNERLEGPPQAARLISLYRKWIDAERLAASSPRISLAGPAAALQTLQREIEGIEVAPCMASSKAALALLARTSTDAFLGFMSKEPTELPYQVIDRPKLVRAFEAEITKVRCQ